jgi:hypothetical protein
MINMDPLVPPRNNSMQPDKPQSHRDLMNSDGSNDLYSGEAIGKDVKINISALVTIDEKL